MYKSKHPACCPLHSTVYTLLTYVGREDDERIVDVLTARQSADDTTHRVIHGRHHGAEHASLDVIDRAVHALVAFRHLTSHEHWVRDDWPVHERRSQHNNHMLFCRQLTHINTRSYNVEIHNKLCKNSRKNSCTGPTSLEIRVMEQKVHLTESKSNTICACASQWDAAAR